MAEKSKTRYSKAYKDCIDRMLKFTDHNFVNFEQAGSELENEVIRYAKIFNVAISDIYDDLKEVQLEARKEQRDDDELRYGHLDEYGEPK
jgi:adenosine deaminase